MLTQISDSFGSFSEQTEVYLKELVAGFSITASLVCDQNGNTVGKSGSSKELGNQTDLALLIALRRKSQVILTSGATFRADQYRFPRNADLAVLTTGSIAMDVPVGQKLLVKKSGYLEALRELSTEGYSRVHVEYGITGIRELLASRSLDALFLSSKSLTGLQTLASQLAVTATVYRLDDLYIGLVAWQPKLSTGSR